MNSGKQREVAQMPSTSQHTIAMPKPPQQRQDRRGGIRYALHARVVFGWKDAAGQQKESRGHTRDVAQKGTFIVAPECPPKGTAVTLSIFLPVTAGEKRMLRMDADGSVIRAERPAGQPFLNGFAVSHRRMNLFGG
jgi:hypothetical protein